MVSADKQSIEVPEIKFDFESSCLAPHQRKYEAFKNQKDSVSPEMLTQEITSIKNYLRDNQINCFKYNYSLEEIVQNFTSF